MADTTVVIGADDTLIRSAFDRLKSDIKGKSAEMSKDFAGAFKNADTDATAALRKINAEYDKVAKSGTANISEILRAQQKWSSDTSKLSTDVKAAHDVMGASTGGLVARLTAMTTAAAGAGIQTGLLGQVIGALTSPIGLVAVAIVALTLGYHNATAAVLENARQVRELMAVSGLSADAADNLADTFQILGKDTNTLTTSLFRMSGELDAGGEAFRNLGIDVRDTSGQLKMEGDLFLEVRDRISDIASASTRASIAQDIFGRGARQLADIFAMSRAEYQKWSETAAAISPWSQAQQDAAKEYTRNVNQLAMQWDAFWLAIGTPLISVGGAVLTWINTSITAVRNFGDTLHEFWMQFATDADLAAIAIAKSTASATAAKAAFDAARGSFALPEEGKGVSLAGRQAFDPTTLAKAAREQLHQLELQLKLIQATDADKPILALTQALEEFRLKYGEAAAEFAKNKIFDALIDEAKAKSALAVAGRVFEQIAQKAQESAAVVTRATQENMAARLLTEETGAIKIAEAQAGALARELAALQANLPKAIAAGPDARYAAERQIAEKTTALKNAQSAVAVLLAKQETAEVLADLALQQTGREQVRDQTIALLESQSTRAMALFALSGATETEIINATFTEAQRVALEKGRLLQQEIETKIQANETLFQLERDRRQKEAELTGQSAANAATVNAALLAADTARLTAVTQLERDEARRIQEINNTASQEQLDALKNTTTGELAEIEGRIGVIQDALAASGITEVHRQELLTNIYVLEGQKRVAAAESDASKRLNAVVVEMEGYERLRQRDIDNEIKIRAARILGLKSDADRRVEIEAGVVTRVLSERQKVIDNLNTLNNAQEAFFQQSLDGWAAQARAVGDFAGFFDAQFAIALTRGRDFYSSLAALSRGFADDLRSSLSGFFTDFKSNLDKGLTFWQSFTSALSSLWNSLMNSLLKRFADFLVDMALRAAASQNAGGLFAALFGGAAAIGGGSGGTGGVGVVDDLSGPPGVQGGVGGSNILGLASSMVSLVGFASKLVIVWDAIQVAVQAFVTALRLNTDLFTAFRAAGNAFGEALAPLASTLQVVGVVAAAVGIALTAMRTDITDAGKAVQSGIIAAAAALAIFGGFWGMVAAVVLVAIGAILEWTGAFEKASEDWLSFPTRLSETLGKEQDALQAFGDELVKATNLAGIATAIENFRRMIEDVAGVGGFFAATAGQGLFNIPGIPGATGTEHEGGITFDFAPFIQQMQDAINKVLDGVRRAISVTLAEAARQALPDDLFQAFMTGTLEPLRASFEALVASTTATIEDVKKFEAALAAAGQRLIALAGISLELDVLASDAMRTALGGIADAFAMHVIAPLRAQLVALAADASTTADQLAEFQAMVEAVAGLVALYIRLGQTIASLSPDPAVQLAVALQIIQVAMLQAGQAVTDATENYLRAIAHLRDQSIPGGPDVRTTPAELLAAAQALEAAIIARYQLEMQLIQGIEAAIQKLLDTVGNAILATLLDIATLTAAVGDRAAFDALLASLQALAATSQSTALRLWAINAGLQAIAASLSSIITGNIAAGGALPFDPAQIGAGIVAAAGPFFDQLIDMYNQAMAAGDTAGALSFLQSMADGVRALAAAAIAGVQQWAEAAKQAYRDMAQEQIARIQEAAQAAIDANDAQIKAIQEAARAQQEANKAQIDALSEQRTVLQAQVRLSEQWAATVKSLSSYITGLLLGPQAPPNPMAQFTLAQSNYQAALARFRATPSTERAGDVQTAASQLLTAAQAIYTRPSPEYRALFDMIVASLEQVRDTAATFVTPEEQSRILLAAIDAEIKRLSDLNRTIADDAARQVQALQDANAAIRTAADAQIKAVNDALAKQLKAIDEAARLEIAQINAGLTAALQAIAAAQIPLLEDQLQAQLDLLNEITNGVPLQTFMAQMAADTAAALALIQADIARLLANGLPSGGPPTTAPIPPPLNQIAANTFRMAELLQRIVDGLPQHAHGTAYTPGGLAVLHPGEAVLPPLEADRYRAGSSPFSADTTYQYSGASSRGGDTITVNNSFVIQGYNRDPKDILDEAERRAEQSARVGVIATIIQRATK